MRCYGITSPLLRYLKVGGYEARVGRERRTECQTLRPTRGLEYKGLESEWLRLHMILKHSE